MPRTAENPAEAFRMVSEQLLEIRAEVLATRVIAIHALRSAIAATDEPATTFGSTYAAAMQSVTELTRAEGEDPDNLLEPIVKIAARRVEGIFEELKRTLGLRPATN